MLVFFPTLYKDELIYSALARYVLYTGVSSRVVSSEILGASHKPVGYKIAGYLKKYSEIREGMNAEKLLKRNTAFNFYASFHKQDVINKARTGFINSDFENAIRILRIRNNDTKRIRYCPICIEEDETKYGEPYHHVSHALDGVLLCPKHLTPLYQYRVKEKLIYAALISSKTKIRTQQVIHNLSAHKKLANLAMELIERDDPISIEDYKTALNIHLMNRGFLSDLSYPFSTKLKKELLNYYTEEFLKQVNAVFDFDTPYTWVNKVMSNNNRFSGNIVCHLLLIGFFSSSLESFLKVKNESNLPTSIVTHSPLDEISSHNRLMNNRNKLLTIIADNLGIGRGELCEMDGPLYRYFIKNDKEWFDQTLPRKYIGKPKNDWASEDMRYLKLCKAAYKRHILNNNTCRITRSYLAKVIKKPSLLTYIDRLPCTSAYLNQICETHAQYRLRTYKNLAIEYFLEKRKVPTPEDLFIFKSCCRRKYFEEVCDDLSIWLNQMDFDQLINSNKKAD